MKKHRGHVMLSAAKHPGNNRLRMARSDASLRSA